MWYAFVILFMLYPIAIVLIGANSERLRNEDKPLDFISTSVSISALIAVSLALYKFGFSWIGTSLVVFIPWLLLNGIETSGDFTYTRKDGKRDLRYKNNKFNHVHDSTTRDTAAQAKRFYLLASLTAAVIGYLILTSSPA